MKTSELRYLLRFLPRLIDLEPYLLDDIEFQQRSDRDEIELKVLSSWDDLASINSVLSALLKNRPLPF